MMALKAVRKGLKGSLWFEWTKWGPVHIVLKERVLYMICG